MWVFDSLLTRLWVRGRIGGPGVSRLAAVGVLLSTGWLVGADVSHAQERASCPEPVTIVRMSGENALERTRMRLVRCDGTPDPRALEELSILARPLEIDPPEARTAGSDPWVAAGIRRLDPGLLVRLQRISDRFPDREIQIVSGFRPNARRTSRHRTAQALDVRVDGVSSEALCAFLQSFPETGVGYYPNSTFTHLDVRDRSVHWVDRSTPGQRADYGRVDGDPFPEDDPAMGGQTERATLAREPSPRRSAPAATTTTPQRGARVAGRGVSTEPTPPEPAPSESPSAPPSETAAAETAATETAAPETAAAETVAEESGTTRPFTRRETARFRDELRRELSRLRL
jgi:hypothetical protein